MLTIAIADFRTPHDPPDIFMLHPHTHPHPTLRPDEPHIPTSPYLTLFNPRANLHLNSYEFLTGQDEALSVEFYRL